MLPAANPGPIAPTDFGHAGQPITQALTARPAHAQPIREFARTPGTRPAALQPRQVALEETFMEVTRDAAGDRTPATSGEPAAAAFVLRRRSA
jgi:hypothetical protein